ncbi:MAG TPA: C39 family peptidase [Phototrophicaceae bacterium]|nr:C39 family peptidase [Phototrophicaceae bacterium]
MLPLSGVFAQETRPASHEITGFTHIPQHWNNCGPATLTMALTYFGVAADQTPAANWLKPNPEDGNVNPWQLVDYVNTQLPGTTRALMRVGGDLETLKSLLVNNFPVIIEEGYDPEPERLGWMGHFLLLVGYDDGTQMFKAQDSYLGPNRQYAYADILKFWNHFNNTYVVVYDFAREQEVLTLLGDNADVNQNYLNALELNRQRALQDPNDAFVWFNMGTNYVKLASVDAKAYDYAAVAFDKAREIGLPWRMLWYQFGPYEAYNAVGRYQDVLDLAHTILSEPGTSQHIEETFYYVAVAREGLGEPERALINYQEAVNQNTNFTLAREAIKRLQGS